MFERDTLVPIGRRALVVALSGLIAYQVGELLDIGFKFIAISAVIVSQAPSLGRSLIKIRKRTLGTFVGVLAGALVLWLLGTGPAEIFIAIFLGYTVAGLMGLGDASRIAALGALAVVIAPAGGPLESAGIRFLDISLGAVIGLIVMLIIYPDRAGPKVLVGLAAVPEELAKLLSGLAASDWTSETATKAAEAQKSIRQLQADLGELRPLIKEAGHEPSSRHQHPAIVAATMMHMLGAADSVIEERRRLRSLPPVAFREAAQRVALRTSEQLAAAAIAIRTTEPVGEFPDQSEICHALLHETEELINNPPADSHEMIRLVSYSTELRRLAQFTDSLEGLTVVAAPADDHS